MLVRLKPLNVLRAVADYSTVEQQTRQKKLCVLRNCADVQQS